MSSDCVAISVDNVSKHYLMFDRPEDRLKQMVVPRLQRLMGRPPQRYYRDFAALEGVSFEVKRGETVGVIGRNGCGKSTLLQIICGTLQPSSGAVAVNGRIAALLELGAGFNPEFTGRENVYINGAILGLTRAEIDARFDAIADFADIGLFIEQPTKTYSSGMYVRLAFAVAINVDPDILVVDEALAVGDEAFQRKCFARIEDIQARGGTILLVSHSAQSIVQFCSRAMLFDDGELLLVGQPKLVVNQYQRLLNLTREEAPPVREEIRRMNGRLGPEPLAKAAPAPPKTSVFVPAPQHANDGWFDPGLKSETMVSYEGMAARIDAVGMTTLDGRRVNVLVRGQHYLYTYDVKFSRGAEQVSFGMLIKTVNGVELAGATNEYAAGRRLATVAPGDTTQVSFEFKCQFLPGTYFTNAGVMGTDYGNRRYLHRLLDAMSFRVVDNSDTIDNGYFGLSCVLRFSVSSEEYAQRHGSDRPKNAA